MKNTFILMSSALFICTLVGTVLYTKLPEWAPAFVVNHVPFDNMKMRVILEVSDSETQTFNAYVKKMYWGKGLTYVVSSAVDVFDERKSIHLRRFMDLLSSNALRSLENTQAFSEKRIQDDVLWVLKRTLNGSDGVEEKKAEAYFFENVEDNRHNSILNLLDESRAEQLFDHLESCFDGLSRRSKISFIKTLYHLQNKKERVIRLAINCLDQDRDDSTFQFILVEYLIRAWPESFEDEMVWLLEHSKSDIVRERLRYYCTLYQFRKPYTRDKKEQIISNLKNTYDDEHYQNDPGIPHQYKIIEPLLESGALPGKDAYVGKGWLPGPGGLRFGKQRADGRSIVVAKDGSFYLIGEGAGGTKLLRVSKEGGLELESELGLYDAMPVNVDHDAKNGSLYISGECFDADYFSKNPFVLKFGQEEMINWQDNYRKDQLTQLYGLSIAPNDGVVLVGPSFGKVKGTAYINLFKLDDLGNDVWEQSHEIGGFISGTNIAEDQQGDICFAYSAEIWEKDSEREFALSLLTFNEVGDIKSKKQMAMGPLSWQPRHLLKINPQSFMVLGTFWDKSGENAFFKHMSYDGKKIGSGSWVIPMDHTVYNAKVDENGSVYVHIKSVNEGVFEGALYQIKNDFAKKIRTIDCLDILDFCVVDDYLYCTGEAHALAPDIYPRHSWQWRSWNAHGVLIYKFPVP